MCSAWRRLPGWAAWSSHKIRVSREVGLWKALGEVGLSFLGIQT